MADGPRIAAYLDCARATGASVNDRFAVVSSEGAGEKGLFLFTERAAYFLPLGAPDVSDRDASEFLLRTNLAPVGEVFLVFRDRASGDRGIAQQAIGVSLLAPPSGLPERYRYTPALDALGEHALDAMRRKLVDKISRVHDFLTEKHRFSPPAEARAAFATDREEYLARLARCRSTGDPALEAAVAVEERRLAHGFTSATIWERQVGRPLVDRASLPPRVPVR